MLGVTLVVLVALIWAEFAVVLFSSPLSTGFTGGVAKYTATLMDEDSRG